MIPVTELDAGFLLEESFESGQHPFLTTGNYAMVAPGRSTDPIQIHEITHDSGGMTISFNGGQAFRAEDFIVQSSSELNEFSDGTLVGSVTGISGEFQVSVPFVGSTSFFRILRP